MDFEAKIAAHHDNTLGKNNNKLNLNQKELSSAKEGVSATLSGSCLHRLSTTCKNPSLVLGAHPTTAVGESNPFIIKGHPIPFNASGPPSGAVTVNAARDSSPFNTRGNESPFNARGNPPTGAVTVNAAGDSSPFNTYSPSNSSPDSTYILLSLGKI